MRTRTFVWAWLVLPLAFAACKDLRSPNADTDKDTAGSGGKGGSSGKGGAGGSDDGDSEMAGRAAAGGGGSGGSAGSSGSGGSAGAAGKSGAGGSGGSTAGAGGAGGSSSPTKLPFSAKNVPADAAMSATGDLIFNTVGCNVDPEIDTSTGKISGCGDLSKGDLKFSFSTINQSDTSLGTLPAALIVTRRFVVEQGMKVTVTGNRPLIVVALQEALIAGQLQASATGSTVRGGGFGPTEDGQNGLGPGGGGKGNGRSGGGGAGFCGRGGKGGASAGLFAEGGKSYGNPENVPLIGGSSGAKIGYYASAGGGAIQITAGERVEVSALGVIHVGGGGPSWTANGAGAGGAILLEAPNVRVLGHLAANGGGGSAAGSDDSATGADGSNDDQPALGGRAQDQPSGGDGAAGSKIDGGNGGDALTDGGRGAGGGGGAGRIRINAMATPDLKGALISPAQDTPCFSVGKLE